MEYHMPQNISAKEGVLVKPMTPGSLEDCLNDMETTIIGLNDILDQCHNEKDVIPVLKQKLAEYEETGKTEFDEENAPPQVVDIKATVQYIMSAYEDNKYLHRAINEGKPLSIIVTTIEDTHEQVQELAKIISSGINFKAKKGYEVTGFHFQDRNESIQVAKAIDYYINTYCRD